MRTEGRVSGDSQVSVNARISMDLSEISSLIRTGLLNESEMEVAERELRWTKLRLDDIVTGPGLTSTSPARMSREKRTKFLNRNSMGRWRDRE